MLRVFVGTGDAWELLRLAAKRVWGIEELPEVIRQPGGKPVFAHGDKRHFNLSHSGEFVLCALSDRPVGADIEMIRPRKDGLIHYALDEEEQHRFQELGGDWPAFYTLWTQKESIVKYTGEGLKGFRHIHVPEGCTITYLSGEGWKGAVCGHERAEEERV